jgi:hypothetical protein
MVSPIIFRIVIYSHWFLNEKNIIGCFGQIGDFHL